jgi:AraC-like DNA-binding protein
MTTTPLKQIAELASRWGFKDLSTFNRAFKKHYGCTPSAYRKSHLSLAIPARMTTIEAEALGA